MTDAEVHDALLRFFRTTAKRGFQLPLRFRLWDAEGHLLREFTIHATGIEQTPSTRRQSYTFPLLAVVRAAGGRTATVKLGADAAERVKYSM